MVIVTLLGRGKKKCAGTEAKNLPSNNKSSTFHHILKIKSASVPRTALRVNFLNRDMTTHATARSLPPRVNSGKTLWHSAGPLGAINTPPNGQVHVYSLPSVPCFLWSQKCFYLPFSHSRPSSISHIPAQSISLQRRLSLSFPLCLTESFTQSSSSIILSLRLSSPVTL